jgi:hypothetical protein
MINADTARISQRMPQHLYESGKSAAAQTARGEGCNTPALPFPVYRIWRRANLYVL